MGPGREILLFPAKIDFGKLREANTGSAGEVSGDPAAKEEEGISDGTRGINSRERRRSRIFRARG
jgi:glycerol-3-phosphate O-acyltransferase